MMRLSRIPICVCPTVCPPARPGVYRTAASRERTRHGARTLIGGIRHHDHWRRFSRSLAVRRVRRVEGCARLRSSGRALRTKLAQQSMIENIWLFRTASAALRVGHACHAAGASLRGELLGIDGSSNIAHDDVWISGRLSTGRGSHRELFSRRARPTGAPYDVDGLDELLGRPGGRDNTCGGREKSVKG